MMFFACGRILQKYVRLLTSASALIYELTASEKKFVLFGVEILLIEQLKQKILGSLVTAFSHIK